MPYKFMAFCSLVLGFYIYANNNGIVYSAFFSGTDTAQKGATVRHK